MQLSNYKHLNSNVNSNLCNHGIIFVWVSLWMLAAAALISKKSLQFLPINDSHVSCIIDSCKKNYKAKILFTRFSKDKNYPPTRKKMPHSLDQALFSLTCLNVEILVI